MRELSILLVVGLVVAATIVSVRFVDGFTPIEEVVSMPPTYRNITVEGDFGVVTIVGDDAESFLDYVLPRHDGRREP